MNTYEIIKELVKQRLMTVAQLERTLDLSNGSISKWAKSKPNSEPLEKVADYLNVSTDYLLGRTDNPSIAKDDTIAGYTSDDLRKMAENAKTFDGKPLTEEDIDAIQNIIEIYLRGR
ncbi:helix-turn-helix transcriptional regulator [Streptococcus chosunense]|nr:MAG TPA: repressor protein [Caudoviricetes sp.]